MKSKKCKVCSKEFTPKKYAPCKTKCQDCITDFDKEKRFKYLKKQLEKPLKQPVKIKVEPDMKWAEISKQLRLRDKGKPCICCDKIVKEEYIDAGHLIPRSKLSKKGELYYNLDNIHAQCRNCNQFRTDKKQVEIEFLIGVKNRYGIGLIEKLKAHAKKENVNFDFGE